MLKFSRFFHRDKRFDLGHLSVPPQSVQKFTSFLFVFFIIISLRPLLCFPLMSRTFKKIVSLRFYFDSLKCVNVVRFLFLDEFEQFVTNPPTYKKMSVKVMEIICVCKIWRKWLQIVLNPWRCYPCIYFNFPTFPIPFCYL